MATKPTKTALLKLLEASVLPMYALDSERSIVFANDAVANWLGVKAEQLLGQRCDYQSQAVDSPLKIAANCLAPPPDILAGERSEGVLGCTEKFAGKRRRRVALFHRLSAELEEGFSVLAILATEDLGDGDPPPPQDQLHLQLGEFFQQFRHAHRWQALIGNSSVMQRIRQQGQLAARCDENVLIVGPVGSGREHLARTIQYGDSERMPPPLVSLACQLLDAELLENTVDAFLHRCAETGQDRIPILLLLELDQLGDDGQLALQRILSGPSPRLRILATSQRDLIRDTWDELFLSTLAYAVSTIEIRLPPLSDRLADLPPLLQMLLEQANSQSKLQLAGFDPAAMDRLMLHTWPGNVDELSRVVDEACRRADGPWVTAADLPKHISLSMDAQVLAPPDIQPIDLDQHLSNVQRELIHHAMTQAKGNKAEAARMLSVSRGKLLRRIEQLGLTEFQTGD